MHINRLLIWGCIVGGVRKLRYFIIGNENWRTEQAHLLVVIGNIFIIIFTIIFKSNLSGFCNPEGDIWSKGFQIVRNALSIMPMIPMEINLLSNK